MFVMYGYVISMNLAPLAYTIVSLVYTLYINQSVFSFNDCHELIKW